MSFTRWRDVECQHNVVTSVVSAAKHHLTWFSWPGDIQDSCKWSGEGKQIGYSPWIISGNGKWSLLQKGLLPGVHEYNTLSHGWLVQNWFAYWNLPAFFGDIKAWGCNLIVVTFNLLLQWFSMEGKWWIVCQMRLPLRSWAPHEFTSQVRHRRKFACMRAHVQFRGHNASCEQSSLGSEKERLHSIFKWMFQVHLLGIKVAGAERLSAP